MPLVPLLLVPVLLVPVLLVPVLPVALPLLVPPPLVPLLLPEPLLLVVFVTAVVVDTLAVVRLRLSAGSFPLINVIAITSHAATNRATAPLSTRERISRFRCALVMPSSFCLARRNSMWAA